MDEKLHDVIGLLEYVIINLNIEKFSAECMEKMLQKTFHPVLSKNESHSADEVEDKSWCYKKVWSPNCLQHQHN